MRRILTFIFCLMVAFSAKAGFDLTNGYVPRQYKKYFINCCNNKNTTIRSLIDIDGYFTYGVVDTSKKYPDTSYNNILFYEDGFCVTGWSGYGGQPPNLFLDEVNRTGKKDYFYENNAWGKYEIKGDTIVVRSIIRATFMRPVEVDEVWYKVIDKHTIQRIYVAIFEGRNKFETKPRFKSLPAYFTLYDHLPPSEYSWIKRQKCKECDD